MPDCQVSKKQHPVAAVRGKRFKEGIAGGAQHGGRRRVSGQGACSDGTT